jgi:hypothetical protein
VPLLAHVVGERAQRGQVAGLEERERLGLREPFAGEHLVADVAETVALQRAVRQGREHQATSVGSPQWWGEIPSQRRIISLGTPIRSRTRATTVSTSSSMVLGLE